MANLEQNQRNTYLAIAINNATFLVQSANLDAAIIAQRSQIEADEINTTGFGRLDAQLQIADIEDQVTEALANIRASVAAQSANYRGQADILIAGYQVANIKAETGYQISTIQGEIKAQSQAIGQEATIRADTTSGVATAQKGNIDSEAAIDSKRYGDLANIQAAEIRTRAGYEAVGEVAVANIQASTTTVEADIGASSTVAIARAEALGISTEADIDSALTSDLATFEVTYIQADNAAQIRSIVEAAKARAFGTRTSADIQAKGTTDRANVEAQSIIDIARARHDIDIFVALRHADVIRYVADSSYAATVYVADRHYDGTVYRADVDYNTTVTTSDINLFARRYTADQDSRKTHDVAVIDLNTTEIVADKSYSETIAREDSQTAVLQAKLAYKLSGWTTLLPQWQAKSTVPTTPSTPGYNNTPPMVSRRAPYTRSAIDRKINSRFGKAATTEVSQLRAVQGDTGGRGCGAWSTGVEGQRMALAGERVKGQSLAWSEEWRKALAINAEKQAEAQQVMVDLVIKQNQDALQSEATWIRRNVGLLEQAVAIVS